MMPYCNPFSLFFFSFHFLLLQSYSSQYSPTSSDCSKKHNQVNRKSLIQYVGKAWYYSFSQPNVHTTSLPYFPPFQGYLRLGETFPVVMAPILVQNRVRLAPCIHILYSPSSSTGTETASTTCNSYCLYSALVVSE